MSLDPEQRNTLEVIALGEGLELFPLLPGDGSAEPEIGFDELVSLRLLRDRHLLLIRGLARNGLTQFFKIFGGPVPVLPEVLLLQMRIYADPDRRKPGLTTSAARIR